MVFQPENQLWRMRKTDGAPRLYTDPEVLWAACVEYFEWCTSTPIIETKAHPMMGQIEYSETKKLRAMTWHGLATYLGVWTTTLEDWRSTRPDLKDVLATVEQIIYEQKFTGAAAGVFNPMLVSRDLGLTDRQEVNSTVKQVNYTADDYKAAQASLNLTMPDLD